MTVKEQIVYYPVIEIIKFSITLITSIILLSMSDISMWFLPGLAILCYSWTLKNSYSLELKDNHLKIIPFNPFIGNISIYTKSIKKINPIQSIDVDDYNVYGAPYFINKRKYEIEYLNAEGLADTAYFSISNESKERIILAKLKSAMAPL